VKQGEGKKDQDKKGERVRKVHAQGCLFLIIPYKLNNFCCNSAHQYNSETEDEEENLFFLVKQEKVSHLAEI